MRSRSLDSIPAHTCGSSPTPYTGAMNALPPAAYLPVDAWYRRSARRASAAVIGAPAAHRLWLSAGCDGPDPAAAPTLVAVRLAEAADGAAAV